MKFDVHGGCARACWRAGLLKLKLVRSFGVYKEYENSDNRKFSEVYVCRKFSE